MWVWRMSSSSTRISGELEKDVPQLDCFSRPSVATAVLRQDAERLFSQFVEAKATAASESARKATPIGHETSVTVTSKTWEGEAPHWPQPRMALATKGLQDLANSVEALNRDLEGKLMMVYFENNLSNQFLNCYLKRLQDGPGPDAVVWATYALACAHQCGRTEEVFETLRQVSRFQQNPKDRKVLEIVMARWRDIAALPANGH